MSESDVRPVRLSSMVQCSQLDSLFLKFNFALRTIAVPECCVTWQQWMSIPIPPLRKLFIQINTVESVFWRGREHAMPVRDHDEHHRRVMQLIASMDWTQLEACVQQSPDLLRVDLMLCVDSAFFRRGWCQLPASESAEISGRTGPSDFMQEAIRSKLSRRTRAMIHFVEPDNESNQSYQMYLDTRSVSICRYNIPSMSLIGLVSDSLRLLVYHKKGDDKCHSEVHGDNIGNLLCSYAASMIC